MHIYYDIMWVSVYKRRKKSSSPMQPPCQTQKKKKRKQDTYYVMPSVDYIKCERCGVERILTPQSGTEAVPA